MVCCFHFGSPASARARPTEIARAINAVSLPSMRRISLGNVAGWSLSVVVILVVRLVRMDLPAQDAGDLNEDLGGGPGIRGGELEVDRADVRALGHDVTAQAQGR